jgi:hypothetical protein
MTMRRGQFQHVFTFIMLIIIAGVVVVLGYKLISSILGSECEVAQIDFRTSIEKQIQSYSSYGTFKRSELPAPCDAFALCFIDASLFGGQKPDGSYPGTPTGFSYPDNPVIESEVRSPSIPPANVFLIQEDRTVPLQFFSDKITVATAHGTTSPSMSNGVLCVNATSGRFHVNFEGKGRTVVLSDGS